MKTVEEKLTYKNLPEFISVDKMKIINDEYNQRQRTGILEEDSLLRHRARIAFEEDNPNVMHFRWLHHEIATHVTNQYFNRPLSSIDLQ